jgi:hypothetical protein
MSRRVNHFVGVKSPEVEKSQAQIIPWVWDMKNRFPKGGKIDFSAWKVLPDIARPLMAALWKNLYEDSKATAFKTAGARS